MQHRVCAGLGDFENHATVCTRPCICGSVEISIRGLDQAPERLVPIGGAGAIEFVEHGNRAHGAELEHNAESIGYGAPRRGSSVQIPIAPLDDRPDWLGSMRVVEAIDNLDLPG